MCSWEIPRHQRRPGIVFKQDRDVLDRGVSVIAVQAEQLAGIGRVIDELERRLAAPDQGADLADDGGPIGLPHARVVDMFHDPRELVGLVDTHVFPHSGAA